MASFGPAESLILTLETNTADLAVIRVIEVLKKSMAIRYPLE